MRTAAGLSYSLAVPGTEQVLGINKMAGGGTPNSVIRPRLLGLALGASFKVCHPS